MRSLFLIYVYKIRKYAMLESRPNSSLAATYLATIMAAATHGRRVSGFAIGVEYAPLVGRVAASYPPATTAAISLTIMAIYTAFDSLNQTALRDRLVLLRHSYSSDDSPGSPLALSRQYVLPLYLFQRHG